MKHLDSTSLVEVVHVGTNLIKYDPGENRAFLNILGATPFLNYACLTFYNHFAYGATYKGAETILFYSLQMGKTGKRVTQQSEKQCIVQSL